MVSPYTPMKSLAKLDVLPFIFIMDHVVRKPNQFPSLSELAFFALAQIIWFVK